MILRRPFVPALAVLLTSGLPASLFAQAPAVISAGSAAVAVGDVFNLPVSISGVSDLFAFQFDLTFDHTVLQLLNISEGPFLPSAGTTFFVPGTIDNTTGTATGTLDVLIGMISGANGSGTLADFHFQAVNVGTSPVDVSGVTLLDSAGNDIPFTISNGSVTVSQARAVPEPRAWTWAAPLLGVILLFRRLPLRAPSAR